MPTTNPRTAPVVDYAAPVAQARRRWETWLLRIALGCALLPMAAGILTTLAWLLTGVRALEDLGFAVILIGVLLFGVGMICCLLEIILSRSAKRSWRVWLPRTALAAVLLLANFPLALGCMRVASLSRVRVVNHSAGVVTSCVVTDPRGRTWQLGPIAPGESASRRMHLSGRGPGTYATTTNLPAGAVTGGGTFTPYVPFGAGEWYTITVHPDGTSTPPP